MNHIIMYCVMFLMGLGFACSLPEPKESESYVKETFTKEAIRLAYHEGQLDFMVKMVGEDIE